MNASDAAIGVLVATRLRARAWLARDGVTQILAHIEREPRGPSRNESRNESRNSARTDLARVCRAVNRTERVVDHVPFIGKQCLHRALGRYAALRCAGFDPVFVLGVRKDAPRDQLTPELVGHAWVEIDGVPVLEREPPEYVVTYTSQS